MQHGAVFWRSQRFFLSWFQRSIFVPRMSMNVLGFRSKHADNVLLCWHPLTMTQLHFVLMTATSGAPNKFVDVGSPVVTWFTAQTMPRKSRTHSSVLCYLLAENLSVFFWLVVWNMNFIFPYIGNNHPTDKYFSEGSKPPSIFSLVV